MAVYRAKKTGDYTVMKNTHLRERTMSLRAKGLLSLMLSLPDTWSFSIGGLCAICAESETALRSTLSELKRFGYVRCERVQDARGKFRYVYDIFETPQETREMRETREASPHTEKPHTETPHTETPHTETPRADGGGLSNTDGENTDKQTLKESRPSFDGLIDAYCAGYGDGEERKTLLKEWLRVRKAKRGAMTNASISLNLEKIDENAKSSGMSVLEYLGETVRRGWQTFYPIAAQPCAAARGPDRTRGHMRRSYCEQELEAIGRDLLDESLFDADGAATCPDTGLGDRAEGVFAAADGFLPCHKRTKMLH